MAVKEVTIKVIVEGQEIVLTGKQVELFKQNIIQLKEQLAELGERTEENAEMFDKLTGDLGQLEKVFGEVKDEAKDTNEEIDNTGKKSEKSGEKVKSLRAQLAEARNSLAALGPKTAENAAEFDRLTTKVQNLSEEYEDLQFGTKKLDDALAAIPGPIGQVAQGFKTLDDTSKNIKSAFGSLGRSFKDFGDNVKNFKLSDLKTGLKNLIPSLDGIKTGFLNVGKAIIATGIGALVALLGLLAAALIKSLASMKPIQDAVGRLGTLFEVLMDAVKPIAEFIANVLVKAMDGLGRTIAFLTGNLDEYNKKLADKSAAQAAADNLAKLERDFEANGDKYDKYTQRKIKADLDYQKKVQELRQQFKDGEIKSQAELDKLISDFLAKRNREIDAADTERQTDADNAAKAAREKAQQEAEKRAQLEKQYKDKLRKLDEDYTINSLTNVDARGKEELQIRQKQGELKLQQDRDAQLREIAEMKIVGKNKEEIDKKRKTLEEQTRKNSELAIKQFNENIAKEERLANENLIKENRDRNTALIEDNEKRALKEAENRKNDALEALKDSKASAEEIAKAKLAIEEQFEKDSEKIKRDAAKKKKDIDTQIALEAIDNKLKSIDLESKTELEKIAERDLFLKSQRDENRLKEESDLLTQLQNKELTKDQYEQKFANIGIKYANLEKEAVLSSQEQQRQARENNRNAVLMLANSIGGLAQAFGEESAAGKALIKVQQGLALATTISAIADQFKGLGQAAKQPFPANIIAIATFIGTIGTAITQFKSLFGIGVKDLTKGGGDLKSEGGSPNLGKNYASGGMIGGRRHAQGGTLIEAEAGEAIMNRGSVTMFRDVLSSMNQMGGGTAFNRNALMTSYDSPVLDKPAKSQEPVIMKTYVVSNELTTEAEKQARLKDLSTL